MNSKVLFVDDEPNVLAGYQRQMRKLVLVDIAGSGEEALQKIRENGPYAVVMSDMRMPNMNGVAFLEKVIALAPDTVRMMLTGNADQQTAIEAINNGKIFRFLTKPCTPEEMCGAITAGIDQYRLVTAEKELLEKTLISSVNILVEMLHLADPVAASRARKLRESIRSLANTLEYENLWELELAALLAEIGHLTLPSEVRLRERQKVALYDKERDLLARVPEISHDLIVKIPRLDKVAYIIRYSRKCYNGSGAPIDGVMGDQLPRGSRILKILMDLIEIEQIGTPKSVALRLMRTRHGWYDKELLDVVNTFYNPVLEVGIPNDRSFQTVRKVSTAQMQQLRRASPYEQLSMMVDFDDLIIGDVLVSDLIAADGSLLLSAGNLITDAIYASLRNYVDLKGVKEPIQVAVTDED